ncbi:MAG: right-handed parallel beta-helix repeat-containing protein [Cyanobacteria bacterium J06636_16]
MTKTHRSIAFVIAFFVSVLLAIAVGSANAPASDIIYVSTTGNDQNTGTEAAPLASIAKARDLVRERKQGNPEKSYTVYLRQGTYYLNQSLKLGREDSGVGDAVITYSAAAGEEVHLIGGKPLVGIEPVTDETILDILPSEARGNVYSADLTAIGLSDVPQHVPRGTYNKVESFPMELFFQGKPLQLARYPNPGAWIPIVGTPGGRRGRRIAFASDRPGTWRNLQNAMVHGNFRRYWSEDYLAIDRIDAEKQELILKQRPARGTIQRGMRFYVLNVFEALDSPGEWFYDAATNTIYFWPPNTEDMNSVFVSVLEDPLISIENAENIHIQNLTLEMGRNRAIAIKQSEDILLSGLTLRNVSAEGVSIQGGKNNTLQSSDIYNTGAGGVEVSGGDRQTLTPGNHRVVNNRIYNVNRILSYYHSAIALRGVGNYAGNNEISYLPHTAIQFGGNDHVIEYNRIHHVVLDTDDAGVFYTGRDWTARGHVIRHNYIYEAGIKYIRGIPQELRTDPTLEYELPESEHGTKVFYFDDLASGANVYGNVVRNADEIVRVGGGRDMTVANNIFMNSRIGIFTDARGLNWAADRMQPGGRWRMYEKLEAVNHDQPPYVTRYPELATLLEGNPALPEGHRYERNIFSNVVRPFRERHMPEDQTELLTKANNITEATLPTDDLKKALESVESTYAANIGFEAIPIDRVGLQEDDYRSAALEIQLVLDINELELTEVSPIVEVHLDGTKVADILLAPALSQNSEGRVQLTLPAMTPGNAANASAIAVAFYNNDTGINRKLKVLELAVNNQQIGLDTGTYAERNEAVEIERGISQNAAELAHGDSFRVPIP